MVMLFIDDTSILFVFKIFHALKEQILEKMRI